MKIKFYGTRGSFPVSGSQNRKFGGATTCVLLTFGKTQIMIDAGSGVTSALRDLDPENQLNLLMTHGHLDHISGIVSLLPFYADGGLRVYGAPNGGLSTKEQFKNLMRRPVWPVGAVAFDKIEYTEIGSDDFFIDGVKVSTMQSNHPDGATLYRLEKDGESVVIAFDFSHGEGYGEKLCKFADGAGIIIYDGNMSDEEYAKHSDWGHSTFRAGAEIAAKTGSKLIVTHYSAGMNDDSLFRAEAELKKILPDSCFSGDGMTVEYTHEGIKVTAEAERERDVLGCLLDVGIMLSTVKDPDVLLEKITRAAMYITGADGGTLYTVGKKDGEDCLDFRIMITKSKNFFKGGKGSPIDIPPVSMKPDNVSSAAVLEHRLINIPDVYDDRKYDFSGPKKYDALNGYRTKSMLTFPMVNDRDDTIGVMQLINATDCDGNIIAFSKENEQIMSSIASQAAISLTNMNYSKQVIELLNGFVKVMSNGIDARTPYNANHTRNMVKYGEKFFEFEKANGGKYDVPETEKNEIIMSVWLHDVGKLITPLEIMDKSTRLGPAIDKVMGRFDIAKLVNRLDKAEGRITAEEAEARANQLNDMCELVKSVNSAGFLPDEKLEKINALKEMTYTDAEGNTQHLITDDEYVQLSIRKGTLTQQEREIMQGHVSMTSVMLSGLTFPKDYSNVPFWAGSHHEFLNGRGYPNKLSAEQIPWQVRIITILDVFEALTARDRPYKPPMPTEKALSILDAMVNDGQVDSEILEEFKKSRAWE